MLDLNNKESFVSLRDTLYTTTIYTIAIGAFLYLLNRKMKLFYNMTGYKGNRSTSMSGSGIHSPIDNIFTYLSILLLSVGCICFILYVGLVFYKYIEDYDEQKKEYGEWYSVLWNTFMTLSSFFILLFFFKYLSKTGLHLVEYGDKNHQGWIFNFTLFKWIITIFAGIYSAFSSLFIEIFGYKKTSMLTHEKTMDVPFGVVIMNWLRLLVYLPFQTDIHDSNKEKFESNLQNLIKECENKKSTNKNSPNMKSKPKDCNKILDECEPSSWIIYTFYLIVGGLSIYGNPYYNFITAMYIISYFYYKKFDKDIPDGTIRLLFLKGVDFMKVWGERE